MKLTQVGYFSRTHGIKGELVLREEQALLTEEATAIFIETSSGMSPHFIVSVKSGKNGIIVGLEDIKSESEARKFVGKKVHADKKFTEEIASVTEWIGYAVHDVSLGLLGEIITAEEAGTQLLITIIYNDREVILPLVDELIEKVDERKKIIHYKTPAGLLDL